MKPYFQNGIISGLILFLLGCTPTSSDGARFCRSSEGIRKYIKAGGDPNLQVTVSPAKSSDGEIISSLLSCAVGSGDLSLVQMLVSRGADVNRQDSSRFAVTPLHNVRNLDIAKFLIDRGADVNAKSSSGSTPLFGAASYEIASLLIDRGGDVKAVDERGSTPLHRFAGGQTISDEYKQTELQISQLLISKGGDVNAKNFEGNTPLHEVFDKDLAALLVVHGAKVKIQNKQLQTPLHKAARNSCRSGNLLDFLLHSGAEVNAGDDQGKTPLHWAIERGGGYCKEKTAVLLKYGADVDLKDQSGISPLAQAIQNYEKLRGPYKIIMPEEEALIRQLESHHNPLIH
jgi:ankyrin repeat protein